MTTPKMNIRATVPAQDSSDPVTVLTEEECWELAEQAPFARLGTVDEGRVFIAPLNIAVHEGKIYFRTAAGSKLTRLQITEQVTVEFDRVEGGKAFSVNIHGTARLLTDTDEIDRARKLNIRTWLPTEKIEFVEITPTELTGRRFKLGS
ncbi:pyridoxamine 5'-phosphate oxidase family protein [Rothia sp. LK2588]|uniref:pyridoxamine 5'-phosphate oxidase family protein n=1 Tax=Rothia sp. LK2588 TaxID=3114369 RepID=UPI0034CD422B